MTGLTCSLRLHPSQRPFTPHRTRSCAVRSQQHTEDSIGSSSSSTQGPSRRDLLLAGTSAAVLGACTTLAPRAIAAEPAATASQLPAVPKVALTPQLSVSRVIKGCWQLSGGHKGDRQSDRTGAAAAVEVRYPPLPLQPHTCKHKPAQPNLTSTRLLLPGLWDLLPSGHLYLGCGGSLWSCRGADRQVPAGAPWTAVKHPGAPLPGHSSQPALLPCRQKEIERCFKGLRRQLLCGQNPVPRVMTTGSSNKPHPPSLQTVGLAPAQALCLPGVSTPPTHTEHHHTTLLALAHNTNPTLHAGLHQVLCVQRPGHDLTQQGVSQGSS